MRVDERAHPGDSSRRNGASHFPTDVLSFGAGPLPSSAASWWSSAYSPLATRPASCSSALASTSETSA